MLFYGMFSWVWGAGGSAAGRGVREADRVVDRAMARTTVRHLLADAGNGRSLLLALYRTLKRFGVESWRAERALSNPALIQWYVKHHDPRTTSLQQTMVLVNWARGGQSAQAVCSGAQEQG